MVQRSTDHDTFTGTALAQMTLAQKLCELREDRFEITGLTQSFVDNVRVFGLGRALLFAARRARLVATRTLPARIESLRAQIDHDIAAIHDDPAASSAQEHQRGRRYVAEVQEVLQRFGEASTPHELALLRAYLQEHQLELAHERALLDRTRASTPPSDAEILARKALIPVAIVLAPIAITIAEHRLTKTWPRPAPLVPERTAATHGAVRAAHALYGVVFTGYAAVNAGLARGDRLTVARQRLQQMQPRITDATQAIGDAARALQPYVEPSRAVASAASRVDSSWTHERTEQGRTERTCRTERDSHGQTREVCSSRYVCERQDHVWRFSDHVALTGLQQLDVERRSLAGLAFDAPDASALEAEILRATSEPTASAQGARAQHELVRDLRSSPLVTVVGELGAALAPYQRTDAPPQRLQWIQREMSNPGAFPAETRLVDRRCMPGSVRDPQGFTEVRAFARPIVDADAELQLVVQNLARSRPILTALETQARALRERSEPTEEQWIALSDACTALYRLAHPRGSMAAPDAGQRVWRTAVVAAVSTLCAVIALLLWREREKKRAWR